MEPLSAASDKDRNFPAPKNDEATQAIVDDTRAKIAARGKVTFDPKAYNEWANRQLQPGDKGDPARALARRVKMHEFVMTGGLVESTENGITTYGIAVDPAITPDCPWHGAGCEAWIEIVEGRGHGSFDGPTLRELRERTAEEIEEARKADDIEGKVKRLSIPRSVAKRYSDSDDYYDRARLGTPVARKFETRAEAEERVAKEELASSAADLAAAADSLGDAIVFDGDEDEPFEEVSGNGDAQ